MGHMSAKIILFGEPEGNNHSEDLEIDGTNIKMDIYYVWRVFIGFVWLRTGNDAGFL